MPNAIAVGNIDPFDPQQNPLGTKSLSTDYLTAGNTVLQAQAYSTLVDQQMTLDVSGIDAGLAVLVNDCQSRLQGYAGYVLDALSTDYIRLVVDGGNLSSLMLSFAQLERSDIIDSWSNLAARRALGESIGALQDNAGQIYVDMGTFSNHATVAGQALDGISKNLSTAIDTALASLGTSIQATSQSIDALTVAISKNIDDIVAGANVAGGAVRDLGIGLLTTFSGEIKEPDAGAGDGKPPAKPKPGGDPKPPAKPPSVEFVVTAINAGSTGVSQWSAAQESLTANNKKLAAAYQSLAQQSTLLAVAKVVQAQMKLFVGAVDSLVIEAHQLKLTCSAVRAGLQTYGNSVQGVHDQAGATQLGVLAQGAASLWSAFNAELAGIRQSLMAVGPGGLAQA